MSNRRTSSDSRRRRALPRNAALAALLTFTALALAACEEPTGPAPEIITELPRELSAAEARVIEGSNAFAFRFLGELVAARDGENVFTSPLSASMAFGMAMNGAAGDTWTQMREVLGFAGLEEEEINQGYHDLITLLRGLDPAVTFGLANSMWVRDDFTPEPDFVERLRTWFDAEARAVDFAAPATVDVINGWVSDATEGRIEDLIEAIPPEMILYLINAIYFNGDWRDRFDPDRTAPAPFSSLDGGQVTVPMMEADATVGVAYDAGATIVDMPYGAGAFTATAVLPPADADPAAWVQGLTAERWAAWVTALDATELREVTIRLPKFELEWESSLNAAMQALGMTHAYDCDGQANFTRIYSQAGNRLCILESKQMTFLKVDEEGTEAAAATYVGIGVTSAGPGAITFDRPFLLAIRERLTGTLLFVGLIGNPAG